MAHAASWAATVEVVTRSAASGRAARLLGVGSSRPAPATNGISHDGLTDPRRAPTAGGRRGQHRLVLARSDALRVVQRGLPRHSFSSPCESEPVQDANCSDGKECQRNAHVSVSEARRLPLSARLGDRCVEWMLQPLCRPRDKSQAVLPHPNRYIDYWPNGQCDGN